MIARTWRGETLPENADAYLEHLRTAVVPELEQLDGFGGCTVLRRPAADRVAFVVTTLWQSMESLVPFAGERPEVAVVPPEAQRLLARFDPEVEHHDVALRVERPA